MGRTNATYRNKIDQFQKSFKPFKKGLRNKNKKYLDSLWEKMHRYSSAGSYMNSFRPGLVAVISMLIGVQEETEKNREEIKKIKKRLEEIEDVQD